MMKEVLPSSRNPWVSSIKVVLLSDFNARVGKVADDNDMIGKFGEESHGNQI